MSANYDEYLHDHVKNVGLAYNMLCELMPDIRDKVGDPFFINQHDLSKWNDEEYGAYDRYFYGGNRSASVMKEFNYAWLTHIHNNPHHWQYWVLINDDDGENRPLEMPYSYIVEMICDWWSFSWKDGDVSEILGWYDEHKDKMELHRNTRKEVEKIIGVIRDWVEKETTLEHHGIKGQKWGVKHGPPYPLDDEVASKVRMKGEWDDKDDGISYYRGHAASKAIKAAPDAEKLSELKKLSKDDNVEDALRRINSSEGDGTGEGRYFNCQNCAVAFEMVKRGYDVKSRPMNTGENVGDIAKNFKDGKLERAFTEKDPSKWKESETYLNEIKQMYDEENAYRESKKTPLQKLKERIKGGSMLTRFEIGEDDHDIAKYEGALQEAYSNLRSTLQNQGEGARGVVVEGFLGIDAVPQIMEGQRATAFHAMNYEVGKDGVIKIYDTQSHNSYKSLGREVREYDNGRIVFPGFADAIDPREIYFMRTDNLEPSEEITKAVYSRK